MTQLLQTSSIPVEVNKKAKVPFVSSILGDVSYPKNVLREYLSAFKNKCQAEILSYFDGWVKTKRSHGKPDWVQASYSWLGKNLGYCKKTISTHIKKLVKMGVLIRREVPATFVVTETKQAFDVTSYEYQISVEDVKRYIQYPVPDRVSPHRGKTMAEIRSKNTSTPYQKECDPHFNQIVKNTTTQNPVVDFLKEEKQEEIRSNQTLLPLVKSKPEPPTRPTKLGLTKDSDSGRDNDSQNQPTDEQVASVQPKLEKLGLSMNSTIRKIIGEFYENVEDAIACVAEDIKTGRKINNPPGYFVEACKEGYKPNSQPSVTQSPPQGRTRTDREPTEDQLEQLKVAKANGIISNYSKFGDVYHVSKLDDQGRELWQRWWEFLGVKLKS